MNLASTRSLGIGPQVFANMVLVAHELFKVKGGGVVEQLAGFTQQEWLGVEARRFAGGFLCQYGSFGKFQHAVQAAQHGEREDDFAVFRLLVVAAQQVGYGPEKEERLEVAMQGV
jgi:hypothetical protein